MHKAHQDQNTNEIEFDGIEELSLNEIEDVAGGPLWFAIWAGFAAWNTALFVGQEAVKASKPMNGRFPQGGRGSDRRLKTDIKVEGEIASLGINAYSWVYKDAPGERFVGVMAQDLLARDDLRSAVFKFADGPFAGFYGVDYAKLGLACLPTEAWDGEVESLIVGEPVLA